MSLINVFTLSHSLRAAVEKFIKFSEAIIHNLEIVTWLPHVWRQEIVKLPNVYQNSYWVNLQEFYPSKFSSVLSRQFLLITSHNQLPFTLLSNFALYCHTGNLCLNWHHQSSS